MDTYICTCTYTCVVVFTVWNSCKCSCYVALYMCILCVELMIIKTCSYNNMYMNIHVHVRGGGLRLVLLPLVRQVFHGNEWLMNLITSDVTEPQVLWFTMCIRI